MKYRDVNNPDLGRINLILSIEDNTKVKELILPKLEVSLSKYVRLLIEKDLKKWVK